MSGARGAWLDTRGREPDREQPVLARRPTRHTLGKRSQALYNRSTAPAVVAI